MNLIESCMAAAKAKPARVVFPDAIDERAIHAAQRLARQGWAKPVLLANPFELRRYCKQRGIVLGDVPVIDPQYSQRLDAYVEHYCAHRPGTLPEEASAQMRDPLWFGAMMLAQGDTDLCIAGNLAATASVLRAGLRVIGLAEGMKTVSSIMFLISPDGERVLGFADCGVVPEPNSEQLADIAIAAADNYRAVTGITSRVATTPCGGCSERARVPRRLSAQPASQRTRRSIFPRYGGRMRSVAFQRACHSTGIALVKASKPARPWYWPMPLGPMPPNGRLLAAKCSSVSLTVTPPAISRDRMVSITPRSWLKGYSASGRSRVST